MRSEQTNIKVVVRVRPFNSRELEQNQRCVLKVLDDTTLLFDPDEEDDGFFFQGCKQNYRDITKRVNKKLTMEYDRVFDISAHNQNIFEECTAPLVDGVLNGYNSSVFVYGATGAGKTFTMLGNDISPGLTYLTMQDLFQKIELESDTRRFEVGVSYLEVYNEQVMNLITKEGPLKLLEDTNGVIVSGLALCPISSANELLRLLRVGNENRTQHPTDANAESSRSHAIFQVHIRMTDRKTGTKRTVKLSMIDLAGSERASSTKGMGVRFKEGASINKSLLALGNCINKLADGLKHIPYRDSNLTRILKDSLGGNCQTLMVANVSMSSLAYEDTYNTLRYASRAKKIRTTLRQNLMKSNMPKDFYVKKVNDLMCETEKLKDVIKALELKVAQHQKISLNAMSDDCTRSELISWFSKIDEVYAELARAQEEDITLKSTIKYLQFRIKLKEDEDSMRLSLLLQNGVTTTDSKVQAAAINRLQKQIDKLKEDTVRRRKSLEDAIRGMEQLKRDIKDSTYEELLSIFVGQKDVEIENRRQNMNLCHVSNINTDLLKNSKKMHAALTTYSDMMQQSYESLVTHNKMDPETQRKHNSLKRILKSSNSTTSSEEKSSDGDDDQDHGNELDKCGTGSVLSMKRQRLQRTSEIDAAISEQAQWESNELEPNSGFKVPHIKVSCLNETQVLSTNEDPNKTVTIFAPKESAKDKLFKANMVHQILNENIARIPMHSKDKVHNALLKSRNFTHHGLTRTVATAIQKENKKYSPSKVRKSPRSVVSRAITTTSNFMRKQAIRTNSATPSEAIVRTNRAASFRVKK